MNKTTFYFILAILILIDVVQGRYHKKLMKVKDAKTTNSL
ncbi:MAG: tellurium resistance protein TerC, partial [Bacteroidetes bacterium]